MLAGEDAVTEVPATRWDAELYHDPRGAGEKTPSRWGGFLPEIPFEPLRYGIPPASLPAIEPVQLLALEAARRALEDSGYGSRSFDRTRASVVFGAEAGSDLSNAMTLRSVLPAYLGSLPPALDEQLPKLTEDSFPGILANVIAGRIANRLDLGGANYTVDAACASSSPPSTWRARSWRAGRATWCCAAAPTCTTASTTTCSSPPRTPSRPPAAPRPSTARPTASRSARASAVSSSSGSRTPSGTATGCTR